MKYHMINTLSLDFLQTDLMDFAEHFERLMERTPIEILYDLPASSVSKFDDIPFEELPPGRQNLLNLEGARLILVKRIAEGTTSRTYLVIAAQKVLFRLTAERFRTDRLRLVYRESLGPLRYAEAFLGWITPRFGDPVHHINLELNPILREPPIEIGLSMMETWVAELTALGADDNRVNYEFALSDTDLKRHKRSIAQKAKAYLHIARDLNPGELDELLRGLGYGFGTLG